MKKEALSADGTGSMAIAIISLRQKLEKDPKDPEYIITVFGIGYTFGDM